MKKRILNIDTKCFVLTIALLAFSLSSYSQNNGNSGTIGNNGQAATQWKVVGNNATNSDYLGTNNSKDLIFKTNSVERFRLDQFGNALIGGNLGIGTFSPLAKFDVNGNALFRADVRMPNLTQASVFEKILVIDPVTGELRIASLDEITHVVGYQQKTCSQNLIDNPYWMNGPSKIFVHCPEVFVGIGTTDPLYKLDVRGDGYFEDRLSSGIEPNDLIQVNANTSRSIGYCIDHNSTTPDGYSFKTIVHDEVTKGFGMYSELYQKDVFTMYSNGKMVISNASQKIFQLEANGLIRGRQIKLDLDSWADFVFDVNYVLMPLEEVEEFVNEEKHLPNVPSEEQLIEDGLDLEEMNKILMMKVEELTLYLISQNKSIEELKARVIELESNK